jgi:hypothetical protein
MKNENEMKKNKNSKFFFILRSPRTMRKNRTSPNNGPIIIFFVVKS